MLHIQVLPVLEKFKDNKKSSNKTLRKSLENCHLLKLLQGLILLLVGTIPKKPIRYLLITGHFP